jgi:hypothetical protein
MSYLQENFKYQYNSTLFRLEKIEKDLRKNLHSFSLRNSTKEQVSSLLNNSEKELETMESQIKGINWYAFVLGFAAYHTIYIFRSKILLNEMGSRAWTHLAICTSLGMASGSLVGYSFASNLRLYSKRNQIKGEIARALQQTK